MECQPRLDEKFKPVLYFISRFEKVLLWKFMRYSYPQKTHDVDSTSIRCFRHWNDVDVEITSWKKALKWRRVSTGPVLLFLNGQNRLSVKKAFGKFPLRCPLKHFSFKNLVTKCCKSIFYVSAVNCNYHFIFKGFNYRFSGFLFRTYFKYSCFHTNISNYL